MLDSRIRMLITTVNKLYRRGANENVQRILAKTHIADVAEVIDNLETGENLEVLRLEPSFERRAEILSYLKSETQKELLVLMADEEAQNIVVRMESDDAADLLGNLPEEFANQILKRMQKKDSEDVTDLMGYPEDSAGGLMSSDFLALSQDLTVQEAISTIQDQDDESLIMFYVYVVDDKDKLVGVLSLKQLLLAKPSENLEEVLTSDVISVRLETDQQEVAQIVERYDFLAVPVVDKSQKLMGVITVDDVIDVIREEVEEEIMALGRAGWDADASTWEHIKARLLWLLVTFLGGALCFYIVYSFVDRSLFYLSGVWWYLAASVPLVLALGATAGNQAIAIALSSIREEREVIPLGPHWLRELKIGLPLALFFGLIVFGLGYWLLFTPLHSLFIATVVGLQILFSIFVGSALPIGLAKLDIEPTIISIPLYIFIADIVGVLMLFGLSRSVFDAI